MKISACLVICNEEKLLPRCLESIKDVVDEIIVVHDGPCSDKSLEIVREFGAEVFVRKLVGEAEYHRPFSFKKAKGEWILQIDADEFLPEKTKRAIPKLIKAKDTDAYSFLWLYPEKGEYIEKGPFSKTLKPCLFRENKMFMIGISHEYPRTYGKLVKRPDLHLEHKTEYNNYTRKAYKDKWIKWARLQAEQICHIDKAPIYNIGQLKSNPVYIYYENMRKHPVISGMIESFKYLMIYLTRGILWSGWYSVKIAFFELRYIWLIRFYLLKLKHGKRI